MLDLTISNEFIRICNLIFFSPHIIILLKVVSYAGMSIIIFNISIMSDYLKEMHWCIANSLFLLLTLNCNLPEYTWSA